MNERPDNSHNNKSQSYEMQDISILLCRISTAEQYNTYNNQKNFKPEFFHIIFFNDFLVIQCFVYYRLVSVQYTLDLIKILILNFLLGLRLKKGLSDTESPKSGTALRR